jgi:hypothetical protein
VTNTDRVRIEFVLRFAPQRELVASLHVIAECIFRTWLVAHTTYMCIKYHGTIPVFAAAL